MSTKKRFLASCRKLDPTDQKAGTLNVVVREKNREEEKMRQSVQKSPKLFSAITRSSSSAARECGEAANFWFRGHRKCFR